MPRLFSFVIFMTVISGCAGTAGHQKSSNWQHQKIAACLAAAPQSDWVLIEVPAADNFISNKLAALTMTMGGSNTVDALVKILSQPSRPAIAVIGQSDELTAATLEDALRNLPIGVDYSRQPLCFIGNPEYGVALKFLAERAGLFLTFPDR